MSNETSHRRQWGGSGTGFRNEAEGLATMLRAYAQQELVDPLRSLARFIAFGLLGAIFVATSALLFAMAVLRVLQEETSVFAGNWSFVPYLITAVVCAVLGVIAVMRIGAVRPDDDTAASPTAASSTATSPTTASPTADSPAASPNQE